MAPGHFTAKDNPVYPQAGFLAPGSSHTSALPVLLLSFSWIDSGVLLAANRLQWRDRSGFSPDSPVIPRRVYPRITNFILNFHILRSMANSCPCETFYPVSFILTTLLLFLLILRLGAAGARILIPLCRSRTGLRVKGFFAPGWKRWLPPSPASIHPTWRWERGC